MVLHRTFLRTLVVFVLTPLFVDNRWCNYVGNDGSYSFSYAVDAADVVSQHLENKKNDITTGQYSLLQPDGKVRVVYYKADNNRGFQAVVQYRRSGIPVATMGHLHYPIDFYHPIQLAEPIAFVLGHQHHDTKKFKHR